MKMIHSLFFLPEEISCSKDVFVEVDVVDLKVHILITVSELDVK